MLHITNGDDAARVMKQAGITGDILPWRDVLHEGPTPANLSLEQMSLTRARFIADCGWRSFDEAKTEFRNRDAMLVAFRQHQEVVLWFEHDLYDQLQMLQLLDWFSRQKPSSTSISMICIDEYLGTNTPERLASLYPHRTPITRSQLQLGQQAWCAFCNGDPISWARLMASDTSALAYLAGAVARHLEQYPSVHNGLNRTEGALLAAVHAGIGKPGRIFEATQEREERRFMGDSTFWLYLNAMFESRPALLQFNDEVFSVPPDFNLSAPEFTSQEIRITDAGRRILECELDWIEINGVDKWLGGVHLTPRNMWRWDSEDASVIKSRS